MSNDRYMQTLLDLKSFQSQMACAFDKDVLADYVALASKLDCSLLGENGLGIEACKLLLEIFPAKQANQFFQSALFGANHAMNGEALREMLNLFDEPDFSLTNAMLARMNNLFKLSSNHEILLDWMLKFEPQGEGYTRLLQEIIYKCISHAKRNKPVSDGLADAINIAFPDVSTFGPLYEYFRQVTAVLSAPSLLLRKPESLLRDVAFIRKKESEGDWVQGMHFFKPAYSITPQVVVPIISDPATEWAVLDIMTIQTFKPLRFVGMSLSENPSEAEKVLWAFTRMGATRIHELAGLEVTALAKCFQHHSVYVGVCHKALEGNLGEKVAGRLISNMIEATMLLRGTRKLIDYPRPYEEVVAQVLEPLATTAHLQAIKGMRFELYSSLNDQAAMMEDTAPAFWRQFSTFRGWKSSKVRDTFFASDLGL